MVKVDENIKNGIYAMRSVVNTHKDFPGAMYRDDIGEIDFVWGFSGVGEKFKRGYGIAHIIAKHIPESSEDLLQNIVETIGKGVIAVRQSKKESTQSRVLVVYKEYTALLSLGDETRNTWLLTGWKNHK